MHVSQPEQQHYSAKKKNIIKKKLSRTTNGGSQKSYREKSKVGPKGKRKMRVSECAGKLIKA